ncbi:hypothetical protein DYB28_002656 [Aphanomyces astaci]|uniref:SSD domain-containing protein n=1 Tax=Aphanomyces astaci TaxID=112090 RepID=A0A9X8DLB7_APHAT|nr:hypothetical protein DYB28_002656 [Aphanomyces astaci]
MLRWFFLSNAAVAVAVAADPSWPPTGQCSVPGYTSWTSQCPSLTTSVMPIVVTKRDVGGFGNVNMSALDTLDEARAVLQGTSAVNAMKGMRSESVEYYNSSLANMMITFCYVTSTADELDRCVPPTSPHAQRNKGNASNTCLVVPGDGSCAAKNLCERLPNCLWPTADPTKMHDLLDVLTEVIGNLNINSKNLLAPLHAIQDLQGITTAQVQSVLADTSWVTAGALQLQSIGDNFDLTYTNAFPKTCIQNGDVCLTCPAIICGGSSVAPQATLTEWRVVADQLESTFQMTRDAVYSGSVTLFSAANDAEDMLTSVASATSDSGATVASVQMTFDSISYTRSGLVLSIFILGLFVAFLGMAGFVKGICKEKTKWVHLLHASWGLGVVLCIISFVVASCLIAVSAVWFDGCQYLDMVMNDMTPYFSAETSRVVGAQHYGIVKTAADAIGSDMVAMANYAVLDRPWTLFVNGALPADCTSDTDPALCYMKTKCTGGVATPCYTTFRDALVYTRARNSVQDKLMRMRQDFVGGVNYPNSIGTVMALFVFVVVGCQAEWHVELQYF